MTISGTRIWAGTTLAALVVAAPGCIIKIEPPFEDSGTLDGGWEATADEETGGFESATGSGEGESGEGESGEGESGESTGESGESTGESESESGESESSDTGEESGEPEESGESGSEDTGGGGCELFDLDPRRSLIETHVEALAGVSMAELLDRAAISADLIGDPEFTHTRLVDSFTTSEAAALPGGSYCDDLLVDGLPSLNGYPLQCPREEAAQASNLDAWFPIAYVNRLDLAALDGSDCGEQRVIMANNAIGRMFVIFEARIPNPDPECGLLACEPIAALWSNASLIDDPVERGEQLRLAFLDGHPQLSDAGFEPFMAGVNMSFGSGQVRTNSLDDEPWTLREFRFVDEDGRLGVTQVPVSDNAFGPLWNDLSEEPFGELCRSSILEGLEGLLGDEIASMGLSLEARCFAAESREDSLVDYAAMLFAGSGEFEAALEQRLVELGSDLSAEQVANRATFASNCMGCHELGTGLDLGHGLLAPASSAFVHVDEFMQEPCGGGSCFAISPALRDEFLPARQVVLEDFLQHSCELSCEPGGVDEGLAAAQALLEGPATLGLPAMPVDQGELGLLLEAERQLRGRIAATTLGGRPRGAH